MERFHRLEWQREGVRYIRPLTFDTNPARRAFAGEMVPRSVCRRACYPCSAFRMSSALGWASMPTIEN